MPKKVKAEFFSPEASSEEKLRADMKMTPLERLSLAFRLSDIAMEIRKGKIPPSNDHLPWRELKHKNG